MTVEAVFVTIIIASICITVGIVAGIVVTLP